MCGRFAITLPKQAVLHFFDAQDGVGDDAAATPRYNVRPTQSIWVVARGDADDGPTSLDPGDAARRVLTEMRWGFVPRWAKALDDGPLLINARGETAHEKPAFKSSVRTRRCLIPADGFYEWRASAGRGKEPHWIAPRSGEPLVFAGLWRRWSGRVRVKDAESETVSLNTAAIVTTAANDALVSLHERLPAVIAPADFGLWLGEDGPGAARLLAPPPDDFFVHHPVSRRINKSGRDAPDDADLRAPAAPGADAPAPKSPPETGDLFG